MTYAPVEVNSRLGLSAWTKAADSPYSFTTFIPLPRTPSVLRKSGPVKAFILVLSGRASGYLIRLLGSFTQHQLRGREEEAELVLGDPVLSPTCN